MAQTNFVRNFPAGLDILLSEAHERLQKQSEAERTQIAEKEKLIETLERKSDELEGLFKYYKKSQVAQSSQIVQLAEVNSYAEGVIAKLTAIAKAGREASL